MKDATEEEEEGKSKGKVAFVMVGESLEFKPIHVSRVNRKNALFTRNLALRSFKV